MLLLRWTSPHLSSLLLFTAILGQTAAAAACDFTEIFNGKDLAGWVVEGKKEYQEAGTPLRIWSVQDGMIVTSGRGYGFLRYDKELKDFVLHVEYRLVKGSNSGIGIRTVKYSGSSSTRPSRAGYEIQVLADAGKPPTEHTSGSLYRYVAPKVNATLPAGEWNVMDVECRGPKIRVTLNGQLLHDLDQQTIESIKDKPLSGYVALQSHTKQVEFRNVRLKELDR